MITNLKIKYKIRKEFKMKNRKKSKSGIVEQMTTMAQRNVTFVIILKLSFSFNSCASYFPLLGEALTAIFNTGFPSRYSAEIT